MNKDKISVYSMLLSASIDHRPFKVDFNKGNLVIDGEYYIKDWKNVSDREIIGRTLQPEDYSSPENAWKTLGTMRKIYLTSVKTNKDRYSKSSLETAYEQEELSNYELVHNSHRDLAIAFYEGFLFLGIVDGRLKWPETAIGWFYKFYDVGGEERVGDKPVILLKKWFQQD